MKTLIIGERYKKKLEKTLNLRGFDVFWLPENPYIDPRLASHCDLSVFVLDNKAVIAGHLWRNQELVNLLTNRGVKVICSQYQQDCVYPKDVNLCALVMGDKLLHNETCTDPAIINNFSLKSIHIKQGYARCTALAVDAYSLITADAGVARAAENAGLDVLKIGKSGIELQGFNEGFVGGAAFKSGNVIYFTGNIDSHPDGREIKSFISERGLLCVSLTDGPLFDIGGAICIG